MSWAVNEAQAGRLSQACHALQQAVALYEELGVPELMVAQAVLNSLGAPAEDSPQPLLAAVVP